jgi:hypothetical protein
MPTNDHDDDATLPNLRRAANDETRPNATSSGNEGARGSRGQANSGAHSGNSTNAGGNERAPQDGDGPDLRRKPGQGGGGLSSESSRSED